MGALVENVHKIAILRANALGDFMVIIPALYALQEAYPNAELVLLGSQWHKDFLEEKRTPINRVIVVPAAEGIREEAGVKPKEQIWKAFFEAMHREGFDIAIHFQGKGIAANPFIKKLNARLTVGLSCLEAEKPDRSFNFYYYQNEVIRYLEVTSLIGAKPTMLEPEILLCAKDYEEATKFISVNIKSPFVVIHPCAMDERRMWGQEGFTAVADSLASLGFMPVFSGSAADNTYIQKIIAGMKAISVNAAGKLSLGGLGALFSKSSLVLSVDTGPLHYARAVEAKTVGLYWAANFINWGPLSRQKHHPLISWEMQCPACGIVPNQPHPFEPQNGCSHNYSFIRGISVETVLNACKEQLYS